MVESERMTRPARIVVVGAGGFGRETLDVIRDIDEAGAERLEIVGVVDNDPGDVNLARLRDLGVEHLGSDDEWLSGRDADLFALAIGSPRARAALAARYLGAGLRPATLVHPSAVIGRRSEIGVGAVICAGAVISTNVRIGRFVHINPHATIGHDARIADYASVNPAAVVSGEVSVGSRTLIGAGAVILEGRVVGDDCVVGASACVTKDVPSDSTVKGVPAR